MKEKLAEVKEKLGEDAYKNPIKVFVYDSGEDAPFTACQGVPGDMIKRAGGISIFNDINKGWATPSWEEVVQRDPDVILILDYSNDTEKKKEFLSAADAFKQAWDLSGHADLAIGFKLAVNYMRGEDPVEAIKVSRAILAQHPNYPKLKETVFLPCCANIRP
jgi:hypothetical protein